MSKPAGIGTQLFLLINIKQPKPYVCSPVHGTMSMVFVVIGGWLKSGSPGHSPNTPLSSFNIFCSFSNISVSNTTSSLTIHSLSFLLVSTPMFHAGLTNMFLLKSIILILGSSKPILGVLVLSLLIIIISFTDLCLHSLLTKSTNWSATFHIVGTITEYLVVLILLTISLAVFVCSSLLIL